MHVVVIGAGVVGVTTAYYLSELGCRVTVVDRASEVADGASFGNAGQLSYSFTDALANPGFIRHIPAILAGRDPGYRVRLGPDLVPWGLRFLAQCTRRKATDNTIAVLQLAMRSQRLLTELRERLPFDFLHRDAGKLVLLDSGAALRAARANAALKQEHGCPTEILSRDAAVAMEPAIAQMATPFAGAVYSRRDAVADARLFALGLREMLEKSGHVEFRLGNAAESLVRENNRLRSVRLGGEELPADAVVVCAGAWSGELLRSVGINPRIYPVRGYSVTLPPGRAAPEKSVTVLHKRAVFSRINGMLRISGFADFRGFRDNRDDERSGELLQLARDVAPLAGDYASREQLHWGGFRPMTPSGRPRVGPSAVDGLFLNTGHGMLGWTLACASSNDIAQAVARSLH